MKKVKRKILLLIISAVLTALFIEYLRFNLSNRIFLKYMFFYMLGIYVSLEYDKYTTWLRKHCNLLILGYIVLSLVYSAAYYYNYKYSSFVWFAFCTASILFVNIIGLLLSEKLDKIYNFITLLGQSSYYIYLMHPLILSFLIKFTTDKQITSVNMRLLIYTVIVIPLTIILSLLYTFIKNKLKSHFKLIGMH